MFFAMLLFSMAFADPIVTDWEEYSTPIGRGMSREIGCSLEVRVISTDDNESIYDLESLIPEKYKIDRDQMIRDQVVGVYKDIGKKFLWFGKTERAYEFRVPLKGCKAEANGSRMRVTNFKAHVRGVYWSKAIEGKSCTCTAPKKDQLCVTTNLNGFQSKTIPVIALTDMNFNAENGWINIICLESR